MDEEIVKKKIGKKEVDDAYARLQKSREIKRNKNCRCRGMVEE